jgi:tetratricopeptide (TPR) repeat protein
MGLPRDAIDDALAFTDRIRAKAELQVYPLATGETETEHRRIESLVQRMAEATSQVLRPLVGHLSVELRALADRQSAKGSLARLLRRSSAERLVLIRKVREFRGWAVCELACAESLAAAPGSADRALELAELAAKISQQAEGDSLWRRRIQGYAGIHLGNAWRVHGKLQTSDEAFGRALPLWKAGAPGDPGLLNEARVLGLEASLRLDQQRPAEALALLDQALAVDRHGESRYLLINRARVLEQLGDFAAAIVDLRKAAPLLDETQEPRQLLVIRFTLLSNLCHLQRFAEAEALLPEVRAQAERLGQGLDMVRTLWLQGWIAAGQGRSQEAIDALEQVRLEFARERIPSDAALVTLQLATLYLEAGRSGDVRQMALALARILRTEGLHTKAVAALRLFYEAVEKEALTVELARRLSEYLFRAQRNPELPFEAVT